MASKQNTCPICQGDGVLNVSGQAQMCPLCDGTGQFRGPGNFFIYEITLPQIGALGVRANDSIQILDKDFKWMFAMATSTGNFSSLVKSGKDKRPFSNQQVHSANFWGTSTNPFPLLTPFIFERRGSILIDTTDLSNANNNIRLAFAGVELD